jgi:transposase-like protein
MTCPNCGGARGHRRRRQTSLGHHTFACPACRGVFNERSGTPFNDLQHPTDIVLLAVLWRLRYKLGFRDVAELLLQRGYEVTHETVRAWEFRLAPMLAAQLRAKRRGQAGVSWYLDETYVKVAGRWCYLYRAIDREGELLDSMLSERRDKHAARRFLRRLVEVTGGKPRRVTTDHHPAYRKAIRWILGRKVIHRRSQYLSNLTEQDHRAVKQRYYPMLGFGKFESAARFCAAFDELRQYFKVRRRDGQHIPLAEQRRLFIARWRWLIVEMASA